MHYWMWEKITLSPCSKIWHMEVLCIVSWPGDIGVSQGHIFTITYIHVSHNHDKWLDLSHATFSWVRSHHLIDAYRYACFKEESHKRHAQAAKWVFSGARATNQYLSGLRPFFENAILILLSCLCSSNYRLWVEKARTLNVSRPFSVTRRGLLESYRKE